MRSLRYLGAGVGLLVCWLSPDKAGCWTVVFLGLVSVCWSASWGPGSSSNNAASLVDNTRFWYLWLKSLGGPGAGVGPLVGVTGS